jgi:hypothetical protein
MNFTSLKLMLNIDEDDVIKYIMNELCGSVLKIDSQKIPSINKEIENLKNEITELNTLVNRQNEIIHELLNNQID